MESFTSDNYYYDWRSSDEENESDDETTLFSSRSFSSDSSASFRKSRALRKSKKKSKRFSSGSDKGMEKSGKLVEDSFAVVKKSSNPYEDFRVSMVEMIVEKNIFGPQELEDLLECFISLNSEEHHWVIFDVFIEIWEVLFSDLV
ncbi:transcription repressor OFP8-like protein [Tanacetum coccineum]